MINSWISDTQRQKNYTKNIKKRLPINFRVCDVSQQICILSDNIDTYFQRAESDDLVQALQRSLDERDDEIKELRAALERQNNERSNTQKQSFESLLDGESMAKEVSLLRSTGMLWALYF